MTVFTRNALVVVLLAAALCCHLFAAHLLAGNPKAYPHHIGGFFFIALLTGGLIALVNRFFRKGRPFPWLFFGALQFGFGLAVIVLQQHYHLH